MKLQPLGERGHGIESIDVWNMNVEPPPPAKPGEFRFEMPMADYLLRISASK